MSALLRYAGISGLIGILSNKWLRLFVILYLSISLFILYKIGINIGGEGAKYIIDANNYLHLKSSERGVFGIFYIVYSLFVALIIKLGLPYSIIAVIQLICSAIAGCALYKTISDITGNRRVGLLGFIFFITCLTVQQWNYFLYSESLHCSFIVIAIYYFHKIFVERQNPKTGMFILMLFLVFFSRPVGVIFMVALAITLIIWLFKNNKRRTGIILSLFGLIVFGLMLQLHWAFYFNPDSLRRMEIICQVPINGSGVGYTEYNKAGLGEFAKVIVHEIGVGNFLQLGFRKVASFYSLRRSFYSTSHNLLLILTTLLFYPMAIIGMLFYKKPGINYVKLLLLLYIGITSVGIFFTCDEWSNRFIVPVLPMVIILACLGIEQIRLGWLKSQQVITSNKQEL